MTHFLPQQQRPPRAPIPTPYCMFCLKCVAFEVATRTYQEVARKGGYLAQLERYFSFDFSSNSGFDCELCEKCTSVVDSVCELYGELEKLELKMKAKVSIMKDVMEGSDQDTKRKSQIEEYYNGLGRGEMMGKVENWRRGLLTKCSSKLSASLPRVIVQKLPISSRISLSLDNNQGEITIPQHVLEVPCSLTPLYPPPPSDDPSRNDDNSIINSSPLGVIKQEPEGSADLDSLHVEIRPDVTSFLQIVVENQTEDIQVEVDTPQFPAVLMKQEPTTIFAEGDEGLVTEPVCGIDGEVREDDTLEDSEEVVHMEVEMINREMPDPLNLANPTSSPNLNDSDFLRPFDLHFQSIICDALMLTPSCVCQSSDSSAETTPCNSRTHPPLRRRRRTNVRCEECGKQFSSWKTLHHHMRIHGDPDDPDWQITDVDAGEDTSTFDDSDTDTDGVIFNHNLKLRTNPFWKQKRQKRKDKSWWCELCKRSFKGATETLAHFTAQHNVSGYDPTKVKWCGEKGCKAFFRTQYQLNLHKIRTHPNAGKEGIKSGQKLASSSSKTRGTKSGNKMKENDGALKSEV